jgi:glycogen debranching enzyme
MIVKYGNLLYNGLIPNSLKPLRYNTRDTCFWWIKAIRDYITYTDDYSLISILEE